jgi:hypothetical protein
MIAFVMITLCAAAITASSAASFSYMAIPESFVKRSSIKGKFNFALSRPCIASVVRPIAARYGDTFDSGRLSSCRRLSSALLSASSCSSLTHRPNNELIIGTRGSPLALAQARETKELFRAAFPELNITIKDIMTQVT